MSFSGASSEAELVEEVAELVTDRCIERSNDQAQSSSAVGKYEVVTKLSSGDGVKDAIVLANDLRTWECAYCRRASLGVLQHFCQFGCAQQVCDAL
jgi:hypothetical protein